MTTKALASTLAAYPQLLSATIQELKQLTETVANSRGCYLTLSTRDDGTPLAYLISAEVASGAPLHTASPLGAAFLWEATRAATPGLVERALTRAKAEHKSQLGPALAALQEQRDALDKQIAQLRAEGA